MGGTSKRGIYSTFASYRVSNCTFNNIALGIESFGQNSLLHNVKITSALNCKFIQL